MPDAFIAILPPEVTHAAVRSGNEWVLPLPQAQEAVDLATNHLIAILGPSHFGFSSAGFSWWTIQGMPSSSWRLAELRSTE